MPMNADERSVGVDEWMNGMQRSAARTASRCPSHKRQNMSFVPARLLLVTRLMLCLLALLGLVFHSTFNVQR